MSKLLRSLLVLVGGASLILLNTGVPVRAAVMATPPGKADAVSVNDEVKDDLWVTGNTVGVTGPVSGELFAAGNTISLPGSFGRSIVAAGNTVTIDKGSGYNTFVAGNTVTLSGTYGHDVYVAANTVTIKDGTVINGELRVAGSDLTLAGTVKGNVYFSGRQLTSSAVIGGSLTGWGDTFSFTGGSIANGFTYHSAQDATGLDKVKITGTTSRLEPAQHTGFGLVLFWIGNGLAVLLAALLLVLFARRPLEDALDEVHENWGSTFLRGLAFVVLVPVLIIVGFTILIGWQVSLILIALYALILMLAMVAAYIFVGQWLLEKATQQAPSLWLSAVVGVVVAALLMALPLIGWLASLVFGFAAFLPMVGVAIPARPKK